MIWIFEIIGWAVLAGLAVGVAIATIMAVVAIAAWALDLKL